MRLIKFRLFKNGKMLYCVPPEKANPGDLKTFEFDNDPWDEREHGVLMQFTNNHDNRGKEIWEGDIVVISNEREKRFGIVEWLEFGFILNTFQVERAVLNGEPVISRSCMHDNLVGWDYRLVIGNKYEHPYLCDK